MKSKVLLFFILLLVGSGIFYYSKASNKSTVHQERTCILKGPYILATLYDSNNQPRSRSIGIKYTNEKQVNLEKAGIPWGEARPNTSVLSKLEGNIKVKIDSVIEKRYIVTAIEGKSVYSVSEELMKESCSENL